MVGSGGERVVAVIQVINKRGAGGGAPEAFTDDDALLLGECANQVSAAVEHAMVVDDMRRKADESLRSMQDQLSLLGSQLTQHKSSAEAHLSFSKKAKSLFKIQRSIAAKKKLESIFDEVMREAHHLLNADRSTLFLLDKDTGELWSKVAEGVDGDQLEEVRFPATAGFAGHAATSGETVNIEDAYADERFSQEVDRKTGYRTTSVLCVPLRGGANNDGAILGVVQVLNKLEGGSHPHFTVDDERLLSQFCTSISGAVVSMGKRHKDKRALQASLSKLEDLSAQLQDKDARLAMVQDASTKQAEAHRVHLERLTHSLLLKFMTNREVRLRKVGFSTWLSMVQEERKTEGHQRESLGQIRGVVLRVMHRSLSRALFRWKEFSSKVQEMMAGRDGAMRRVCSLIANRTQRALLGSLHRWQAAVADIKMAELVDQVQQEKTTTKDQAARHKTRAAEITAASRELNRARKTTSLMGSITNQARDLLHADRATFFVVDRLKQELWSQVADKAGRIVVPLSQGLVGHCACTGNLVNIANAYSDARFDRSVDKQTGYVTRSLLCTPVRNTVDEVVGVLQMVNRGGVGSEEAFDEDSEAFAVELADQIGMAMENTMRLEQLEASAAETREAMEKEAATLYDRIGEEEERHGSAVVAADRLRSLMQVAGTISSQTRLDDVFRAVMEQTHTLLQADRATLFVVEDETEGSGGGGAGGVGDGADGGVGGGGGHAVATSTFLVSRVSEGVENIRIPVDQGICGACASSGEIVNVDQAHDDPRFDPDVDRATGYRTRSLLCCPILAPPGVHERWSSARRGAGRERRVIGVLQVVNKARGQNFDPEDELMARSLCEHIAHVIGHIDVHDTRDASLA